MMGPRPLAVDARGLGALAFVAIVALASLSAPALAGTQSSSGTSTQPAICAPTSTTVAPGAKANVSVSAWALPPGFDSANATASELLAHRVNSSDGNADLTTRTDLAMHVHATGLDDAIANGSGNTSARVLAAFDAIGEFSIRVGSCSAFPYELNATNVHARRLPATDAVVLAVELDDAIVTRPGGENLSASIRERIEKLPQFGHAGVVVRDPDTGEYRTGEDATVSIRHPSATVVVPERPGDDVASPVAPRENRPFLVDSNLYPGTVVVVTATTDGGFTTRRLATVGADGDVHISLDLRRVDPPTQLSFDVELAGSSADATLESEQSIVPVGQPTWNVSVPDQTSQDGSVHATANLSHGGVLVLHDADGVVATSDPIPPGERTRVSFDVDERSAESGFFWVVAHHATGNDMAGHYANADDAANVVFDQGNASTTTDESTTGESTTTQSTDEDTRTTPAPTLRPRTTSTDPMPGFGVVLAFAALAVALASVLHGCGRRVD